MRVFLLQPRSTHPSMVVPMPAKSPLLGGDRFRSLLAQVLATSVKNILLLIVGMSGTFTMIAAAAVHNAKDGLSLSDGQMSWFGGLMFLVQPIGSIASGFFVESIGRKRSMILVNLPNVAGWLLVVWCESSLTLFMGVILIGICMGLQEAPAKTYAGEICEARFRGTLMSYTGVFFTSGMLLEFFLGSVLDWKMVAAVNAGFPMFTILVLTLIPDSPMWLVSKGRLKEAEAALCWLRGWVSPSDVTEELQQLIAYNERKKRRLDTISNIDDHTSFLSGDGDVTSGNPGGTQQESFLSRLRSLLQPDTRRPFLLVILTFLFASWANNTGMMPHTIRIFRDFNVPIDPHWLTVYSGCILVVTSVALTTLISKLGKRRILLFSTAGLMLTMLGLGTYAYMFIPPGGRATENDHSWIAVVLFVSSSAFFSMGPMVIPWMLLSEVFPFRTRGLASGLAASIAQLITFSAINSYQWMEGFLHLHGMYWLHAALGVVAVHYFYLCLPETEGVSLQEIERFFLNKKATSTDIERAKAETGHKLEALYKPCESEMVIS